MATAARCRSAGRAAAGAAGAARPPDLAPCHHRMLEAAWRLPLLLLLPSAPPCRQRRAVAAARRRSMLLPVGGVARASGSCLATSSCHDFARLVPGELYAARKPSSLSRLSASGARGTGTKSRSNAQHKIQQWISAMQRRQPKYSFRASRALKSPDHASLPQIYCTRCTLVPCDPRSVSC